MYISTQRLNRTTPGSRITDFTTVKSIPFLGSPVGRADKLHVQNPDSQHGLFYINLAFLIT